MDLPNLSGKHVLLTRASGQLPALAKQVRKRGGVPVAFPCLQVQPLPDEIRAAMGRLAEFSDVVFTSSNGVDCVAKACESLGRMLQGKRIAVVGEHTARALRRLDINADIIPALASQAGLVAAYRKHGLPDKLLFFRAKEGSELLHRVLTDAGVPVLTIAAYQTICPSGEAQDDADDVIQRLRRHDIDAVLLGSPKAAECYVRRIGDAALADIPAIAVLSERVKACAVAQGLSVQVVAKQASFESILDGLALFFGKV